MRGPIFLELKLLKEKGGKNMYIIATFRSRNHTIAFRQILISYGVNTEIINTPRRANVSCGISVKMSGRAIEIAKEIMKRRRFDSFVGFFEIIEGQNTIVREIY